jgi:aldose 1-epimerase
MQTSYEWISIIAASLCAAGLIGCTTEKHVSSGGGAIKQEPFGHAKDGAPVSVFTLRNGSGVEAKILNYGGLVISLKVPDRNGKMGDVVLGYDNLPQYLKSTPYFGAMVGRYGNRIAKGQFTLDGRQYTLATNNGINALHGGLVGFDKVVWTPSIVNTTEGAGLKLHYVSHDGEEGFPGNLDVTAVYRLTDDNGLRLDYTATTDKATVLNLTQHSYFNLAGHGNNLEHVVMINADKFTPVDKTLIPTGELRPVEGTPFDFRKPTPIGARIGQDEEQLKIGNGYDHNWVLNKPMHQLALAARVSEPTSGRVLEVFTTEPGLQFYTGNFLDGSLTGKYGWNYKFRSAFCMEPQHFPDSPNHPEFPSTVLKPGQTYKHTLIYKFSVQK